MAVFIMILFSILITSCATTPKVNEKDIEGYQLPVQPTDSTAVIYVVRPDKFAGKWLKYSLSMDIVEQVLPNASVVVFIVKPGEHTLVAKFENTNTIPFTAEAGQMYFYQVNAKTGWLNGGRVGVESLDGITGTYQVKRYYKEGESTVLDLNKAFSSPE